MNIQIKPKFEIHKDIIIPLSVGIAEEDIRDIVTYSDTSGYWVDIEVKKTGNNYFLVIYDQPELDINYVHKVLSAICKWTENAHFIIYDRHPERATFYRLELTEIKIKEGKYYRKDVPFKEAIPSSRFLKLKAGGVQQMFDFLKEYLLATNYWKQDSDIRKYLITDLTLDIEYYFKNRDPERFLPSLIQYGEAFALNENVERLMALYNYKPESVPKSIEEVISTLFKYQREDRQILLKATREKAALNPIYVSESALEYYEIELNAILPYTFKKLYAEIGDGGFDPAFGLLPIQRIVKITTKLRTTNKDFPDYIVPFLYCGKGIYTCLNTSKISFPVVNFYREQVGEVATWYEAYEQIEESFEGWLDHWITNLPEHYEEITP